MVDKKDDVEAKKKSEFEILQMIPDDLKKLTKLSPEAQKLLFTMLQQARCARNLSSRPLSMRDEANTITCHAFRRGYLEDLHAGPDSKVSDEEIKKLMIESSAKLQVWLEIRDILLPEKKDVYNALVQAYRNMWTENWEQEKREYEIES